MIHLDPRSGVVPSEQIRAQIADQIRFGVLPVGQRLPSIRQLAGDLRVAAGTVAKAYTALEGEGLIETNRARGTRVAAHPAYSVEVLQSARKYVEVTQELGLEQALGLVRVAWVAQQTDGHE